MISIIILVFNKKYALATGISLISSNTIVQIIKHTLSPNPRPIEYFVTEMIPPMKGVTLLHWNSFPSGHSSVSMAIGISLWAIFYNYKWSISFVIIPLIVGLSRVYLAQHFVVDVFGGFAITIICAYYSWVMVYSRYSK